MRKNLRKGYFDFELNGGVSMQKFKYSLIVLAGGICYGLLSTVIKIGINNGFSIEELIGGQYIFGWLGLFLLVLVFSPYRASKKNGFPF